MASEVTDYLQEQAQAFVLDQLDIPLDAQADVKAGTIDERLPSRCCEDALTISLPARMEIRRNTTVYLKCEGDKPGISIYRSGSASRNPMSPSPSRLPRGHSEEPMLTLAYQDQTLIRGDYLTDPTALIGVRSKRELKPGQPIRLTQVCVVCKGTRSP